MRINLFMCLFLEQLRLSSCGDWNSVESLSDSELDSTPSADSSPMKHVCAATQVDTLRNSICDASCHDEDDYDMEDEEDDCDDEEEDEEEDDEDEDLDEEDDEDDGGDSCSGHSSTTSTSTSNNQRDGGRVCDCCYCEVFGHGMPAVAPTSRNFNEMRERLRMTLSKRKAEKSGGCESSQHAHCGAPTPVKKKEEPAEVKDDRDLEELISFINGTKEESGKDGKKKEKPRKRKDKQKEKKPVVTNGLPDKLPEKESKNNKENSFPKADATNGHQGSPTAKSISVPASEKKKQLETPVKKKSAKLP